MTKKHEELVEGIALLFCGRCEYVSVESDECSLGAGLGGECPDARQLAEQAITLILSAVRDGRLELPGEVGRGDVCALAKGDNTPYYLRFDEAFEEGIETGDRFIALRKEGTGKEEEK